MQTVVTQNQQSGQHDQRKQSPSPIKTHASSNINLIVPRSIMRAEPNTLRKSVHQFLVPKPRHRNREESSENSNNIGKFAALALFKEFASASRFGFNDLSNVGKSVVGFLGAGEKGQ